MFDFQRNVDDVVRNLAFVSAISFGITGVVALYFDDGDIGSFYMLGACINIITTLISNTINERLYTKLYLGVTILYVWLAQLLLPSGPEAWVLILTSSYLFISIFPHLSMSILFLGITITGIFVINSLGFGVQTVSTVSRLQYPTIILVLVCLQTFFIIKRWHKASQEILDHLDDIQIELKERVDVGLEQAKEIAETNVQLEQANNKLFEHQKQVTQINEQLALEQEEQRQIVFAIHQDLREPLRSIVSFIQLIRKRIGKLESETSSQEYLEFVEDGGRRMGKMLDDLLSYAEKDENEASQPIALNSLVEEVLMDLYDARERTQAKITVSELPEIFGQYTQIHQLFQNLLANALKFSAVDRPPLISIRPVLTSLSHVRIEIADNGIGIPENSIEKIFGLFNRSHVEKGYEGSGVGLALCKRIAISHGGDLQVSSVEGEGTTFIIIFPKSIVKNLQGLGDIAVKNQWYVS